MPEISLVARPGRTPGSRSSRRLRASGQLPAVIYGHGTTPLAVAVDARELRTALTSASGANALLSLEVDGTTHLAMAKELQRHPVKGTLLHADFVIVRRDEVVGAEVSVTLVGEAEAVHRADGVVDQQVFSLAIHALPGNIPPTIEVDISSLEVGDAIRVGDLALPDGVSLDADADQTVVVAQPAQDSSLEEGTDAAGEGSVSAGEASRAGSSGGG